MLSALGVSTGGKRDAAGSRRPTAQPFQSVPYCVFFEPRLGSPAAFLAARSPSASHLLALTICTTLIYCLAAITGALMTMQIHGTVESILLARAISIAPAEKGEAKNMLGFGAAGEPGVSEEGLAGSANNVGLRSGEEKERR